MQVSLISPYSAVSSIGVRWLSSYLKGRGHRTQVIFLPDRALRLYSPEVLNDVVDLCRDSRLIGISLTSNMVPQGIQLSNAVRTSLPGVPVVWGGVHPSLRPEASLQHADIVCIGEGEIPLAELADRMESGRDHVNIPNLWFRQETTVVRNDVIPPVDDLDTLGFPDYELSGHFIKSGGRIVPMTVPLLLRKIHLNLHLPPETYVTIATRGCPHSCAYCSIPALRRATRATRSHRRRSKDHVIRELRLVRERYPFFRNVELNDDNFLCAPTGYLLALLADYKREIGLPLIVTGAEPASLNAAKLEALFGAGLRMIRVGIQSAAEKTKLLYRRAFASEKILEAAHILHRRHADLWLPPVYDVILDNPWETEEDLLETFSLLAALPRPNKLTFMSLSYFTGTEITEKALREGLQVHESDNFEQVKKTYINSVFYLLTVPFLPRAVVRLLMRKRARHSKLLAWLPRVVFPAFRLKELMTLAIWDLRSGDLSRPAKFLRRRATALWQRAPAARSSPYL